MRKEVEGDFADLSNKFYRKNLTPLLSWMLFRNLKWTNFHTISREIKCEIICKIKIYVSTILYQWRKNFVSFWTVFGTIYYRTNTKQLFCICSVKLYFYRRLKNFNCRSVRFRRSCFSFLHFVFFFCDLCDFCSVDCIYVRNAVMPIFIFL